MESAGPRMGLTGRIDHYELIEMLGSGAMGEVYKASDTKMGRVVALKILSERLSRNEQACARFRREAEVAANLEHPNIVTIHDRGEFEGRQYFVMEFLDGADLAEFIRDPGSRTLEEKLGIAGQICDALQFAHAHNVVHRDIKPSNIMLTRKGGRDQAKLVDFGIVHIERSSLTRATTQPGTFSYMSPEQLRNDALDHRSDLFSLGIVLYEFFGNIHPFEAPSEALITTRILRDEPEPARSRNVEVPASLDSLILKLLEKDPASRPQTAGEVGDAVRQIQRKIQTRGGSTDPSDYENLDDLTRQMVENIVTWARQKESEGALQEAVKAYEKALTLAPDAERLKQKLPRLKHRIESEKRLRELVDQARDAIAAGRFGDAREHWRNAWILSPDAEEVSALEKAIDEAERTSPEDRERADYVESHVRKAQEALDLGSLDEARMPLVEILRRYPNEPLARFMLDRLMAITASGADYRKYRAALKEGRAALDALKFEEASRACERAKAIWPDDDEAVSFQREIETRRQSELSGLVSKGEDLIRSAESRGEDLDGAIRALEEAVIVLERARALAGEGAWFLGALDEARRRGQDLRQRRETLERERREREEQRRKVVSMFLQRGRNLMEEAVALAKRGPEEGDAAADAYRQGRAAFEKVLEEDSAHAEAGTAIRRIDQALTEIGRRQDEWRSRQREIDAAAEEARRCLDAARPLLGGDDASLVRGLDLVSKGLAVARRIQESGSSDPRGIALERDLAALESELRGETERRDVARRESERRRRAEVDKALAEGKALHAKARSMAAGESEDELRRALETADGAEAALRRAIAVESGHPEAGDLLKAVTTLSEHLRSEIRRVQEQKREAAARDREARLDRLLREAREAMARADAARSGDESALRSAISACDTAATILAQILSEVPSHADAVELEQARERLAGEVRSRLADLERIGAAERAGRASAMAETGSRRLEEARKRRKSAKEDPADFLAALESVRTVLREALDLDPSSAAAARTLGDLERFEREVQGEIAKARRDADFQEARTKLERARALAAAGDRRAALAILDPLDGDCRSQEWLHELVPEIERARASLPRRSGRTVWIVGGVAAAAAVIVLAVFLLRPAPTPTTPASTPTTPRSTAAGTEADRKVRSGEAAPAPMPPPSPGPSRSAAPLTDGGGAAKGSQKNPTPPVAQEARASERRSKEPDSMTTKPPEKPAAPAGAPSPDKLPVRESVPAAGVGPAETAQSPQTGGASSATAEGRAEAETLAGTVKPPAQEMAFWRGNLTQKNRPVGKGYVVTFSSTDGFSWEGKTDSRGRYAVKVNAGRFRAPTVKSPDGRRSYPLDRCKKYSGILPITSGQSQEWNFDLNCD